MLFEILIAGNVMIGPNLCQADLIYQEELYTFEYKCQENGTLQRESVGILQSTRS